MSKKLDKALDLLGNDAVQELEALSKEALETRIAQAEQAMRQAADELEENQEYQQLKESIKALSSGVRDLNKRQKAVILVCLSLRETR